MEECAKSRMDSSVLYMAMVTPPPLVKSNTSSTSGCAPSAGAYVSVTLPLPGTTMSVALYWSPCA